MVYVKELESPKEAIDGRQYRVMTLANIKEAQTIKLSNGLVRPILSLKNAQVTTKITVWQEQKVTDAGQTIVTIYDGLFDMPVDTVLEGHIQEFSIQEQTIESDRGCTYVTSRALFVPVNQDDPNFVSMARKAAKEAGVILTGAQYASTNQFVAKDAAYNGVPSGAATDTGDFAG